MLVAVCVGNEIFPVRSHGRQYKNTWALYKNGQMLYIANNREIDIIDTNRSEALLDMYIAVRVTSANLI